MSLGDFLVDDKYGDSFSWTNDEFDISDTISPVSKSSGSGARKPGMGGAGGPASGTGLKIAISNLPADADKQLIKELLQSRFIKFDNVELFTDPHNKRCKIAVVGMLSNRDVDTVTKWRPVPLDGRKLTFEYCDHYTLSEIREWNAKNQVADQSDLSKKPDLSSLPKINPFGNARPVDVPVKPSAPSPSAVSSEKPHVNPFGNAKPVDTRIDFTINTETSRNAPLIKPDAAAGPKILKRVEEKPRSNPFGNAKPVDTLTKQLEIEQKLQLGVVNSTTISTKKMHEAEREKERLAKKLEEDRLKKQKEAASRQKAERDLFELERKRLKEEKEKPKSTGKENDKDNKLNQKPKSKLNNDLPNKKDGKSKRAETRIGSAVDQQANGKITAKTKNLKPKSESDPELKLKSKLKPKKTIKEKKEPKETETKGADGSKETSETSIVPKEEENLSKKELLKKKSNKNKKNKKSEESNELSTVKDAAITSVTAPERGEKQYTDVTKEGSPATGPNSIDISSIGKKAKLKPKFKSDKKKFQKDKLEKTVSTESSVSRVVSKETPSLETSVVEGQPFKKEKREKQQVKKAKKEKKEKSHSTESAPASTAPDTETTEGSAELSAEPKEPKAESKNGSSAEPSAEPRKVKPFIRRGSGRGGRGGYKGNNFDPEYRAKKAAAAAAAPTAHV